MAENIQIGNLWGDISYDELTTTPASILKLQANEVTKLTKSLVVGFTEISTSRNYMGQDMFEATLSLGVPALQDYLYRVVTVRYGVDIFPAEVFDRTSGRDLQFSSPIRVGSWEELQTALKGILQSDKMKKTLRTLLSQASQE